ncbi:MAG: hypothetical protein JRI68_17165 [Deltaproteobacteria bacterium]|nr:hypothetical protein [Deltaproteobacteria bacterium]
MSEKEIRAQLARVFSQIDGKTQRKAGALFFPAVVGAGLLLLPVNGCALAPDSIGVGGGGAGAEAGAGGSGGAAGTGGGGASTSGGGQGAGGSGGNGGQGL